MKIEKIAEVTFIFIVIRRSMVLVKRVSIAAKHKLQNQLSKFEQFKYSKTSLVF